MICHSCHKKEGNYKIKVYEEFFIDGMLEDKLIGTIFVCENCLADNNIGFIL